MAEPYWVDLGAELLHAAAHGETARLQSLLAAGAAVDAKGWLKNRPLHIACARGQLAAAELLLRSGARVGAANAARATPLHEAAVHGECTCAEACLLFGADASAADRFGSTPLHAAARHGHLEMVRLLVSAGSDHTARDELGMTSRQLAKQQAKVYRKSESSDLGASVAACAEIARVLAEENLETAAATLLLRSLQRLAWGAAMHPRLGGSSGGEHSNPRTRTFSSAHTLSFDLATMVGSMLPNSADYELVRHHRQEQRGHGRRHRCVGLGRNSSVGEARKHPSRGELAAAASN
jgi:hypothetical protein